MIPLAFRLYRRSIPPAFHLPSTRRERPTATECPYPHPQPHTHLHTRSRPRLTLLRPRDPFDSRQPSFQFTPTIASAPPSSSQRPTYSPLSPRAPRPLRIRRGSCPCRDSEIIATGMMKIEPMNRRRPTRTQPWRAELPPGRR